jgi:4-amino-4-deoxy-L-arabinose transferase-like glycosyltransferase
MQRARLTALAVAILMAIAIARVGSTWRIFSQTVDEPIHVAAGLQWLDEGSYTLDVEHPPLPRILFALDAWLDDAHVQEEWDRVTRGSELFYRDGAYERNLAAARAGNLPWFVLALAIVFAWARRLAGTAAGLAALALFGALPPILGHAALTTTDMAVTAMVAAALFFFARWLDAPTYPRAIAFGAAVGVGMLAKFSFLLFFPVGALVLLALRFRRVRLSQLVAAAGVAVFLVIACYRFESGLLNEARMKTFPPESPQHIAARYAMAPGYDWVRPDLLDRYHRYANFAASRGFEGVDFVDWAKAAGYPSPLAGREGNTIALAPPVPKLTLQQRLAEPFLAAQQWVTTHVPIPAMTYILGAQWVKRHSALGHPAFLFGEIRQTGWWYYFPVVLFFKTPIAFLVLAVIGLLLLWRGRLSAGRDAGLRARRSSSESMAVACAPLLILVSSMTSGINIGVRHVLPMHPLLAIAAGVACVELWSRGTIAKTTVAALLVWFFVSTTLAHPDYLAWFNEAARHPEAIAGDSNLDWGQDLLRLTDVVRREKLAPLHISYFGSAEWWRHLPEAKATPSSCATGWIAVSEQIYILEKRQALWWLSGMTPQRRIGSSMRLYFVPDCAKTDPRGQH